MPWANARVAHLLLVHRMTAMKVGDGTVEESSSDDYDQVMFTQNVETIETFSSHVVPVKVGKAYTWGHINFMTQALWTEDSSLPQGLTVQNMYTELRQRSKKIVMVVKNSTAYPQTLQKKTPVARQLQGPRAKATHGVPVAGGMDPRILIPPNWLSGKGMENYGWTGLSGLDSLPLELADAAHWLLAEYHNVFLLDPVELGCTHTTEHMIKVTDETPLKNNLGRFPHLWLRRFKIICGDAGVWCYQV